MGNKVSSAGESLNLWKRDVTSNKFPVHHGRGGTVGGGGNCAADTEVSKQSDVGRNETMVGSCKVVVGHICNEIFRYNTVHHKAKHCPQISHSQNRHKISACPWQLIYDLDIRTLLNSCLSTWLAKVMMTNARSETFCILREYS